MRKELASEEPIEEVKDVKSTSEKSEHEEVKTTGPASNAALKESSTQKESKKKQAKTKV